MTDTIVATSGTPFSQTIRAVGVKSIWTDLSQLEVRAQLRTGKTTSTPLIANLHDHMTWDFDVDDLVITWTMTGQETRAMFDLPTWPSAKKGFFNVVVSDVGVEDARALVVPLMIFKMGDITTKGAGD